MTSITNRFFDKVKVSSDCWEWVGHRNKNRGGYGMVYFDRHRGREWSHRVSFYLFNGRFPEKGKYLRHMCNNPSCVNPEHLIEGTQSENMKDAVKAGTVKSENMRNAAMTRWHGPNWKDMEDI